MTRSSAPCANGSRQARAASVTSSLAVDKFFRQSREHAYDRHRPAGTAPGRPERPFQGPGGGSWRQSRLRWAWMARSVWLRRLSIPDRPHQLSEAMTQVPPCAATRSAFSTHRIHFVGDIEGHHNATTRNILGPFDGIHDTRHPLGQRGDVRIGTDFVILDKNPHPQRKGPKPTPRWRPGRHAHIGLDNGAKDRTASKRLCCCACPQYPE